MTSIALFITHRTRPGRRDAVEAVWREHMASAIADNNGHQAYFYCFDEADPDVISAFQQYDSDEAAGEFLKTDAYNNYEMAVAPLLTAPPEVRRLRPVWVKAPHTI